MAAIRLKPVIYSDTDTYQSGADNKAQQMFLLKALEVTQDPKKLRDMMGFRTVGQVMIMLDKIGMRKEYHDALARNGVSFDFIVGGIKGIAQGGEKDSDRLKAYQALLKSVGMEKYDSEAGASEGSWEKILMEKIEQEKKAPELSPPTVLPVYEVQKPVVPKSAQKVMDDEAEMSSSIYESDKQTGN